jgi:copper oxidase (laccase) domain-containing protein
MTPVIYVYPPGNPVPDPVILPQQVHGTRIVEIATGSESLAECDGVWTTLDTFFLGVRTADCAPVCLWDSKRIGIFHAGWRGLVDGIIEKALTLFDNPQAWVGPLFPRFEIQRDGCAERIEQRFGTVFFSEDEGTLLFDFKSAIASTLPQAEFDPRSTFTTPTLASWRCDRTPARNTTVIHMSL